MSTPRDIDWLGDLEDKVDPDPETAAAFAAMHAANGRVNVEPEPYEEEYVAEEPPPDTIDSAIVDLVTTEYGLTGPAAWHMAEKVAWRVQQDQAGLLAKRVLRAALGDEPSEWAEEDMAAVLRDNPDGPVPSLLRRTDGRALLYPGRVNAILGESESGKGWFALHACCQVIRSAGHIVYVDFEDEAIGVGDRLRRLGLSAAQIVECFHYVRADGPVDSVARAALVELAERVEAQLCVVDGVTEAMVSAGWSMLDNDDVARFYETLPRPLSRTGAAVVVIDHLPKTAEGKGAIGAQHKRSGLDGAAYRLEVTHPFGEGRAGSVRVLVDKDRPGKVRSFALLGRVVGMMVVKPDVEGGTGTEVFLAPIKPGDVRPDETPMPTITPREGVIRVLKSMAGKPMSGNKVISEIHQAAKQDRFKVKGNDAAIRTALGELLTEGDIPEGGRIVGVRGKGQTVNYQWQSIGGDEGEVALTLEPEPVVRAERDDDVWGDEADPFDPLSRFEP